MLFKTFSAKLLPNKNLLNQLSNKRYYCNVNKSDYNLIEQKINKIDEKIDKFDNKLDFIFYLSIISSVSSIFIKVFEG
jgi:hypothetical protein